MLLPLHKLGDNRFSIIGIKTSRRKLQGGWRMLHKIAKRFYLDNETRCIILFVK